MATARAIHIFCSLLYLLATPATAQSGSLGLFPDYYCNHASTINPKVSLPLLTCLVPIGAMSVTIDLLPKCPSTGNASMIMYSDNGCSKLQSSQEGSYSGWNFDDNCWHQELNDIVPSVMFACDDPATHPQPTTTTTVPATLVAGVATGSPVAGGTTTASSATPTTGGGDTTTSGNHGGSATDNNNTTGGGSSTASSSSSTSGLSQSDKIALGVGLGVGLPTVIITLLAWWCPVVRCFGRRERRDDRPPMQQSTHPTGPPQPPHQPNMSNGYSEYNDTHELQAGGRQWANYGPIQQHQQPSKNYVYR